MPSVSIVIATFDRFDLLSQSLKSALAQTWGDFEVLVCDDGGLEETRLVCEEFRDPRIRYIRNDRQLGIAMNTYMGILEAKADLIAFLNDDDLWTPDFLEKCGRPMHEARERVLTFSDHWLIDSEGRRLPDQTATNSSWFMRDRLESGLIDNPLNLLAHNSIPLAMASVFRKSAVNWSLYSERVGGAYDYFLTYCLLKSKGKITYVNERLTEYRVHDRSASSTRSLKNALERFYVNDTILRDSEFATVSPQIRKNCLLLQRRLASLFLRQYQIVAACKHLLRALRYVA